MAANRSRVACNRRFALPSASRTWSKLFEASQACEPRRSSEATAEGIFEPRSAAGRSGRIEVGAPGVRRMWCWRCQIELPMLDEEEFAAVSAVMSQCMRAASAFRQEQSLPSEGLKVADRFKPALDLYQEITGFAETNANAIWHHRISDYGPDCGACGRPLRTPQAKRCLDCGAARPRCS